MFTWFLCLSVKFVNTFQESTQYFSTIIFLYILATNLQLITIEASEYGDLHRDIVSVEI